MSLICEVILREPVLTFFAFEGPDGVAHGGVFWAFPDAVSPFSAQDAGAVFLSAFLDVEGYVDPEFVHAMETVGPEGLFIVREGRVIEQGARVCGFVGAGLWGFKDITGVQLSWGARSRCLAIGARVSDKGRSRAGGSRWGRIGRAGIVGAVGGPCLPWLPGVPLSLGVVVFAAVFPVALVDLCDQRLVTFVRELFGCQLEYVLDALGKSAVEGVSERAVIPACFVGLLLEAYDEGREAFLGAHLEVKEVVLGLSHGVKHAKLAGELVDKGLPV
ncbi:hypothetical protein C0992_007867 [Termitomyces sp. T32_za158]|nr:hypothetical protein C0992_007867 [Termitomyces sp. T32_za158]